jgi:DNA-binding response OmpR family regulator
MYVAEAQLYGGAGLRLLYVKQRIRRSDGKMDKILIIEDDEMLNAGLCFHLEKGKKEPVPAYDLKTAESYLKKETYDLILLDVNLPDGDGFTFARKMREGINTPIIFLTAQDMDEDMIRGFEAGADDYITKPFNVKILMQRIEAILRRCQNREEGTVYRCKNLWVDFQSMTVKKGGEPLILTPTEFKLLQIFCRNPGQVLTRETLLDKLWDSEGNFVDEHTLTINISRLRSKISDKENTYIKTLYGMGYQWMEGKHE